MIKTCLTLAWSRLETHVVLRLRPGERIREYDCIENNEDLQRIGRLLLNESVFTR